MAKVNKVVQTISRDVFEIEGKNYAFKQGVVALRHKRKDVTVAEALEDSELLEMLVKNNSFLIEEVQGETVEAPAE